MRDSRPVGFVLLTAWLAAASAASAQPPSPREKDYWQVVAQYAQGDPNHAIESIGAWEEGNLQDVAGSLESLARDAARCRDCDARSRFEALPIRAAIVLHAARERRDRVARMNDTGGATDCWVRAQGKMVERLLKTVVLQRGGGDFATGFAAAMALDSRSLLCFLRAGQWADAGLKAAPRDANLLVARGLAREAMGTLGYTEPRSLSALDSRGRPYTTIDTTTSDVDRKRELSEARDSFVKALAVEPDQEEARLRLGRVLWRLGQGKEAQEWLRKAIAGKTPRIQYLGHLFLGQSLEESADLEGAAREYRAALSLRPDTQIGAIALAHVLTLSNDARGARAALDSVLPFAGQRKEVDPYWIYATGAPDLGVSLLEALRADSIRGGAMP